jgi:hypothetical protein
MTNARFNALMRDERLFGKSKKRMHAFPTFEPVKKKEANAS